MSVRRGLLDDARERIEKVRVTEDSPVATRLLWREVRSELAQARGDRRHARDHVQAVGALYRPMNNPWLERSYIANMTAHGAPMLPRGGAGMRELIRHLRAGGVVAILLDQYVLDGTPIDFLGHPAPTGTAIAALADRFRVPMIPAYGTRQPDGVHIAIDFEAPIAPGSAEAMTQAAADSLAARVRATRASTTGCTAAG